MASGDLATLGDTHLEAMQFNQAVELYTEFLTQNLGLDDLKIANILCQRSLSYSAMGTSASFNAALSDGLLAVQKAPGLALAYLRAGTALRSLKQFSRAEQLLRDGLAIADDRETFTNALEELAKMRAVESEAVDAEAVTSAVEGDRFQQLEHWLQSGGSGGDCGSSNFPALYMRLYEDSASNRGVHCRVDIPPETEIMAIGKEFLITVEMGHDSPIGRKMLAAGPLDLSAIKHCYLAVFVLWDQLNEDSFFQPYYRILPQVFPNMPIFWTEEELGFLEGSYICTQIQDRKQHIKEDYETLCLIAPELRSLATLDKFAWARMMVASRNFGIAIGSVRTDALVPLADMLNHHRPRQTKWAYDNKRSAFLIHSLTTLRAGQQVYDSYGKKCNSRFLLNYGFAVEHNRDDDIGQNHNEVRLLLTLLPPESDPWFMTKLRMLSEDPAVRSVRISTYHDNDNTQEAFSFLRFVHARSHEMTKLPAFVAQRHFDWTRRRIDPLSADNELRVLSNLASLFREQLMRYPTTMDEDLAELASDKVAFGSNKRNALILLRGEKEICHYYIKLHSRAAALASLPIDGLASEISSTDHGDALIYLSEVMLPLLSARDPPASGSAVMSEIDPAVGGAASSAPRSEELGGLIGADGTALLDEGVSNLRLSNSEGALR